MASRKGGSASMGWFRKIRGGRDICRLPGLAAAKQWSLQHRILSRILLALLVVLAITPELHAEKRIGVIFTGDIPYYRSMQESFVASLKEKNSEAEKIDIILQRPFPDPIAWSNAARKLIAFDVDLIVTFGFPATQAVLHEKTRIPLIFAGMYNPEQAVIAGGNVTGCGFKIPFSSIIRYLKSLKKINTLGILFSGIEEDSIRQYQEMEGIAEQQSIKTKQFNIRSRADLEKLKADLPDAVFFTGSSLVHMWIDDILSILRKKKVLTADIFPDQQESGVLVTLSQPSREQGKMAATMAWQILHGNLPRNMEVYTFRDTELVFNQSEANYLEITFPIHLLIEATKVIE